MTIVEPMAPPTDVPGPGLGTGGKVHANRGRLADRALRSLSHAFIKHGPALLIFVLLSIWLCRHFLFSASLPAGTDMLGFFSRARQNATIGRATSGWDPASFGALRTISLDTVLGLLTVVFRSPFLVVKGIYLLALVATGVTCYALVISWTHRRSTAVVAGLLFLCSDSSLSLRGTGFLNVELAVALYPLLVLAWTRAVDGFSSKRAVSFALLVAAIMLVRIDLILYVAPFLLLYPIAAIAVGGNSRRVLRDTALTGLIAGLLLLPLNAYWLVPAAGGIHARYVTLGSLFSTSDIAIRGVTLYPSLLGFSREIGYFAFSNQETWFSNAWMPLWCYDLVATAVPALAFSSICWFRDRRSLFLIATAFMATAAAPGLLPPFGGVYLFVVTHVPILGDIRDSTRWLDMQALAYAVLAAFSLDHLVMRYVVPRLRHGLGSPLATVERLTVIGLAVLLLLLPVGPTIISGFLSWSPTGSQLALLASLHEVSRNAPVATVPYDQDYRLVTDGAYKGYEHDLGYESPLFTGDPAVGDGGGWDQMSADFAAYTASVLGSGDDAFTRILASTSVRYVLSFHYPVDAPQFLSHAGGPYFQQSNLARMSDLKPLMSNAAGSLFAIPSADSPLTVRYDQAVILGGRQGLAALADMPGFDMADWAVEPADGLLGTGGVAALIKQIHQATMIDFADENLTDIAVLGSSTIADMSGITSSSEPQSLSENTVSDESAELGSLANITLAAPPPRSTSASSAFHVNTALVADAWARVQVGEEAATVTVDVNDRRVGSVTPVHLDASGFVWIDLGPVHLSAGKHVLSVRATPSLWGDQYEVDEVRLVQPGALRATEAALQKAIAPLSAVTSYSFDLAEAARWTAPRDEGLTLPKLASTKGYWIPEEKEITVTSTKAPDGVAVDEYRYPPNRSYHTIVRHSFSKAEDWSNRPYLFLSYRSSNATAYEVVVSSGSAANEQATFEVNTTGGQWITRPLATQQALHVGSGFSWSGVTEIRVATLSTSSSGTLALGNLERSAPVTTVPITLPVMPSPSLRYVVAGNNCQSSVGTVVKSIPVGETSVNFRVPFRDLGSLCRYYIPETQPVVQLPPTTVTLRSTGADSGTVRLVLPRAGVLVVDHAFDLHWVLDIDGDVVRPVPEQSVVEGFELPSTSGRASLSFTGDALTHTGIVLSVLTLALAAAFLLWPRRRARRHAR